MVDKSNRKMRQVGKSGNVGNLCCHGSDQSTSRPDLGIACTNRHQTEAMDGVTAQCFSEKCKVPTTSTSPCNTRCHPVFSWMIRYCKPPTHPPVTSINGLLRARQYTGRCTARGFENICSEKQIFNEGQQTRRNCLL